MQPPFLVILGPTAGGKTRLAIAVARAIPQGGECISADSMQVYRGMDLGTAKPTAEEQAAVPHHLLDVASPYEEGFTVEEWLRRAEAAIADIASRGRVPIVVGGTNLYVRALLEGLFASPPPDPALRARLETETLTALRSELERLDPEAARRIHPNDARRTIRALEVHSQTGQPLSAHQTQWTGQLGAHARENAFVVGIDWPVDAINRRINARVKAMITAGFLEEVRRLAAHGALGKQAREAVGYGEFLTHLAGGCSLDEAVESIKVRSRRYGKQQRTWLRRFRGLPNSLWIDARSEPEDVWPDHVVAAWQAWLRGRAASDPS